MLNAEGKTGYSRVARLPCDSPGWARGPQSSSGHGVLRVLAISIFDASRTKERSNRLGPNNLRIMYTLAF